MPYRSWALQCLSTPTLPHSQCFKDMPHQPQTQSWYGTPSLVLLQDLQSRHSSPTVTSYQRYRGMGGQGAVEKVPAPREVVGALHRHFLGAADAELRRSGDAGGAAEAERVLCARAMTALYHRHAAAIGARAASGHKHSTTFDWQDGIGKRRQSRPSMQPCQGHGQGGHAWVPICKLGTLCRLARCDNWTQEPLQLMSTLRWDVLDWQALLRAWRL